MEHVEPQMCRPDSSVLMSIVLLTIGVSMKYVISTQMLENYGAHSENGKFKDGNAHWKFKGGTDYIVSGLDRPANAVAFVCAVGFLCFVHHRSRRFGPDCPAAIDRGH